MAKDFKVPKYVNNVLKSARTLGLEVFTNKYMPITSDIIKSTSEQISEVREIMRDSNMSSSAGSKLMETGVMKNLSTAYKSALEDITTGNFNNVERADKAMMESFGMDFDIEDEFGDFGMNDNDFGLGDEDDGLGGDFNPSEEVSADAKVITNRQSKTAALMTSTLSNAITNSARVTAEHQMQYDKKKTNITINFLNTHFNQMHGKLSSIDGNIATLVSFNNDVVKAHNERAMQFYEEMTSSTKDILGFIKESTEMSRNMYSDFLAKKNEERQSSYSKVYGSNGINLKELFENAKGNMSNSDLGMMTGMLGDDMMSGMFSNPIGTMLSMFVLPSLINGKLGSSMGRMDKAVGSFGKAFNRKMGTMKNGLGPLAFLASLFHVDTNMRQSVSTSSYNKGPIPFDGETKKAIIASADTLYRIESLLTGRETGSLNLNTGKYESISETKARYKREYDDTLGYGMSDINNKMSSMATNKIKDNKLASMIKSDFDTLSKELVRSGAFFGPDMKYNQMPGAQKVSKESFNLYKKAFLSLRDEDRIKFQSDITDTRDNNADRFRDLEGKLDSSGYNILFNNAITGGKKGNGILDSINSNGDRILTQIRDVLMRGIRTFSMGDSINSVGDIDYSDIIAPTSNNKPVKTKINKTIKSIKANNGKFGKYEYNRKKIYDNTDVYRMDDYDFENHGRFANSKYMTKFGKASEKVSNFAIGKMHDAIYGKGTVNRARKDMGMKEQNEEDTKLDNGEGMFTKVSEWGAKLKKATGNSTKWMKDHLTMDNIKSKMPKFMTGVVGSILGSIVFSNPLIGLLGSMGSFVYASDTAKNVLFGKIGEDGEREGGVVSKKLQDMFKKHGKGTLFGALGGLGVGASLFSSFGIAAPIIGAGFGFAMTFDKYKKAIFGEENKDGEYEGGFFNKKISTYMMKNGKGLFASILGGGILGQMLSPMLGSFGMFAPILMGTMGAGFNIAHKTGRLNKFLFGSFDDEGNKVKDGVINEKLGGILKKFAPKAFKGILAGGLLGGLLSSFGPMGILMGSFIGGATSIGLATDKFATWFSGEKDENGKRTGGFKKKVSEWFENNITSYLFGTKGKYGSRYSDGLFSGLTDWFFGGVNPVTKKREGGITGRMSNWFEKNITSFFFGTKDTEGKREGGLFNTVKDNVKNWWMESIKVPFQEALGPLKGMFTEMKDNMVKLFSTGWDTVKDTINSVFKESVGKPLGELIEDKITKPLKGMITKIVMGVGKVLGSIISAPIKGLNFFAKSIIGKDSEGATKDQANLDATVNGLDSGDKDKKFTFRMGKLGDMFKNGIGTMAFFSMFGGGGKDGSPKDMKDKAGFFSKIASKMKGFDLGGYFSKDENKTTIEKNSDKPDSAISKAIKFLQLHTSDKSIFTRMKGEDDRSYKERIMALYKKAKKDKDSNKGKTKMFSGTGSTEDGEPPSTNSALDKLKSFIIKSKKKDEKDDTKTKKRVSLPKFRNLKMLSFDNTPATLREGTVNIVNENVPVIASYTKSIFKEVDGQFDGVGYNLEEIKNILVTHLGPADKEAKELGRGNKKRRTIFGMIKEFVMSPFKFIGNLVSKLNPFKLIGKVLNIPFKAIKGIFSNLLNIPSLLTGAIGGLGKTIGFTLKLGMDGLFKTIGLLGKGLYASIELGGKLVTNAVSVLGTSLMATTQVLETGITSLSSVLSTSIQALGPMLSIAVNGGLEGLKLLGKGGAYLVKNGAKATKYMVDAGMNLLATALGVAKNAASFSLNHKVEVIGGRLDSIDSVNLVKGVGTIGSDAIEYSETTLKDTEDFRKIKKSAKKDDEREEMHTGFLAKIASVLGVSKGLDMIKSVMETIVGGGSKILGAVSSAGVTGALAGVGSAVGTKIASGGAFLGNIFKGLAGNGAGKGGALGSLLAPAMIIKQLWGGDISGAAANTARYAMRNDKVQTNILMKLLSSPSILKLIGGTKTLNALMPLLTKLGQKFGSKISKNIVKKAGISAGRKAADVFAASTAVAGIGVLVKGGIIAYDIVSGMADAKRLFMIPSDESPSATMRVSAGLYKCISNIIWGADSLFDSENSRAWLLNAIYNAIASEQDKERLKSYDNKMQIEYEAYKNKTGEDISFEDYNKNIANAGMFTRMGRGIKNMWNTATDKVSGAWDSIKNFDYMGTAGRYANKAKWMAIDVKDGIMRKYDKVMDTVTKFMDWWQSPKEGFGVIAGRIFKTHVATPIIETISSLPDKISEGWKTMTTKLSDIWETIKELPAKLWEKFNPVNYVKDKVEDVKDTYNKAKEYVKDKWNNATRNFREGYNAEDAEQREKRGRDLDDRLTSNFNDKRYSYNTTPEYGFGSKQRGPIFGMGEAKFVSQLDSQYADIDMTTKGDGTSVKFKDVGCAPASLSMALSMVGKDADPKDLAKEAVTKGYKLANDGTHVDFFKAIAARYGVPCTVIETKGNKKLIVSAVSNGNPVILLGKGNKSGSPFGETPHYVLITGISGNKFTVNDPLEKEPKEYVIDPVINDSTLAVIFTTKAVNTDGKEVSEGSKGGILGIIERLSKYFENLVSGFTGGNFNEGGSPSGNTNTSATTGMDLSGVDFSKLSTKDLQFTKDPVKNKNAQYAASVIIPKAKAMNIDPTLALAQWAHESAWGTRVKDNAFFGIKSQGHKGKTSNFVTHEYDANGNKIVMKDGFRAYNGLEDATDDYLSLLDRRYGAVRTNGAYGLTKQYNNFGNYATDPNYVSHISKLQNLFGSAIKGVVAGAGRLKSLSLDPNKILNSFGVSDSSINSVINTVNGVGRNKTLKPVDDIINTVKHTKNNVSSTINNSISNTNKMVEDIANVPSNAIKSINNKATNTINSAIGAIDNLNPASAIQGIQENIVNKTNSVVNDTINKALSKPMEQIGALTDSISNVIPQVANTAIGGGAGGIGGAEILSKLDTMINLMTQLVQNTMSLHTTESDNKGAKIKQSLGVPIDNNTSQSAETDRMINMLTKRRY